MAEDVIIDREGTEDPPAFVVPEEYKDKPYMKDIDSSEKLYKAFDGLQTKLGERPAGIPGENSTDEERATFNKAFGVPETVEGYERTEVKLPEGVTENKELTDKLMASVHKAGISASQFKILEGGLTDLMNASMQGQADAIVANDAEFDKLTNDVFSDRKDKVLASAKELIAAHVPEKFKAELDNLPNRSLVILAGVLDGIKQKYISEDTPPGGGEPGGAPTSEAEIRAAARKLMSSEAYTNTFHAEHEATKQKVNELYARIKK